MRKTFFFAALAAQLPVPAHAADCGKLELVNIVHMTRSGGMDLVPVSINGAQKNFVFDTGGAYTQVARPTAIDLQLPMRQGRIQMMSATGEISRDQVSVHEFIIGHMRGTDRVLQVSPNNLPVDGIFATDYLYQMDADVDFGTDTLNFFSQDHCPGQVVYWTSPASVAIMPIAMDGYHITVPVILDGHEERTTIDTGASYSTLAINEAKRLFDLTMGSDDTPEKGKLNGDASLKIYIHNFKSLSIGDVAVNNPTLTLIPDATGRNTDRSPLVSDRTKSEKDLFGKVDMLIGMDVLRKLHVYFAFKEKKMYISPASAPAPAAAPAPDAAK